MSDPKNPQVSNFKFIELEEKCVLQRVIRIACCILMRNFKFSNCSFEICEISWTVLTVRTVRTVRTVWTIRLFESASNKFKPFPIIPPKTFPRMMNHPNVYPPEIRIPECLFAESRIPECLFPRKSYPRIIFFDKPPKTYLLNWEILLFKNFIPLLQVWYHYGLPDGCQIIQDLVSFLVRTSSNAGILNWTPKSSKYLGSVHISRNDPYKLIII